MTISVTLKQSKNGMFYFFIGDTNGVICSSEQYPTKDAALAVISTLSAELPTATVDDLTSQENTGE